MSRTGFNVGLSGQQAEAGEILILESHGAFIFLALWAIWVARGHLRHVLRAALTGRADDGLIAYRFALLGFLAATLFVFGWFVALGLSPLLALFHLFLLYAAYFTIAKYTAASGFSYLFPWAARGARLSKFSREPQRLRNKTRCAGHYQFQRVFWQFAHSRVARAAPSPQLLGNDFRRRWVFWTVLLAFAAGFFGSCLFIIYLGYHYAVKTSACRVLAARIFARMTAMVSAIVGADKTVFDPGKIGVWFLASRKLACSCSFAIRVPWWPLHPLGLAFQRMQGSRIYAFSIFLTWASKLIISGLAASRSIGGVSRCSLAW